MFTDVQSATILFDTQSSLQAYGALQCTPGSSIDIISIEYYSYSAHCDNIRCSHSSVASSYLDGYSSVCIDEDNIRERCYGETRCEFGPHGVLVTQPQTSCFSLPNTASGLLANRIKIIHRCIPQGKTSNAVCVSVCYKLTQLTCALTTQRHITSPFGAVIFFKI